MKIEDFTNQREGGGIRSERRQRIAARTLILHNDPRLANRAREWCRQLEREEEVVADGTMLFDLASLQPETPVSEGISESDERARAGATHRFSSDGHGLEPVERPESVAPLTMKDVELVLVAIDPRQRLSDHWRVWAWTWARSRGRGRGLLVFLDDEASSDAKVRDFFADLALIAGLEFWDSGDGGGHSAREAFQ